MHRVGNILHLVGAGVAERHVGLAAHLHMRRFGNHHPAGIGQRFEPRRDIHPIAIDRAVGLLDDIAKIDADAKPHAPVLGHIFVGLRQPLLDRDRALYRLDDAGKDRQYTVAGGIDNAPAARLDALAKHRARGIERRHRGAIVIRHQPRITRHVGGHYRGDFSLSVSGVHLGSENPRFGGRILSK